jgi:hypothetical protein
MINITHLRINTLLLPAVPCFAFQLLLLMKCTMTRYKPTCLLLSLIVVRIVIANGIRHSRNAWTSRFRARHARPPA